MNFIKAPGNCLYFLTLNCPQCRMVEPVVIREEFCKDCSLYIPYPCHLKLTHGTLTIIVPRGYRRSVRLLKTIADFKFFGERIEDAFEIKYIDEAR